MSGQVTERDLQDFEASHVCGGTPAAECPACGRVHFDGTGAFMEPGELDRYHAQGAIEHAGSVAVSEFGYVHGCPCGRGEALVRLLLEHERAVLRFYEQRGRRLFADCSQSAAALEAACAARAGVPA